MVRAEQASNNWSHSHPATPTLLVEFSVLCTGPNMTDVQAESNTKMKAHSDSQWKVLAIAAAIVIGVGFFVVKGGSASACADKDVQATVVKVLKDNHLQAMVKIPELFMAMGFVLMNENIQKELREKLQVSLSEITAERMDGSTNTHVCRATANFKAEKLNGNLPIVFTAQPDQSGNRSYVVRVQW
jgi:hypothetical protein